MKSTDTDKESNDVNEEATRTIGTSSAQGQNMVARQLKRSDYLEHMACTHWRLRTPSLFITAQLNHDNTQAPPGAVRSSDDAGTALKHSVQGSSCGVGNGQGHNALQRGQTNTI